MKYHLWLHKIIATILCVTVLTTFYVPDTFALRTIAYKNSVYDAKNSSSTPEDYSDNSTVTKPQKTDNLKGRCLKWLKRSLLIGVAIVTIAIIAGGYIWNYINYNPYKGAQEFRLLSNSEEQIHYMQLAEGEENITPKQFMDKLYSLHDNSYLEFKNVINKLNSSFVYVLQKKWAQKDIDRLVNFLLNPEPIQSNSVSKRWLVMRIKQKILFFVFSMGRNQELVERLETEKVNLKNYQEHLTEVDPVFTGYFPNVDPEKILSQGIHEMVDDAFTYPEEYAVVSEFIDLGYGTPEEIDEVLRLIHAAEKSDILEISLDEIEFVLKLRQIDKSFLTYIKDSAQAHNIPPRVLLAMYHTTWTRNYCIGTGIDIATTRGAISTNQAQLLKKLLPDSIETEIMPPNLMAFGGGFVLDAHSTSGLFRFRPVWIKRNNAFSRFEKDANSLSTREIAWLLWNPKYSVEAVAVLVNSLANEARESVLLAKDGLPWNSGHYVREFGDGIHRYGTRTDKERVRYLKFGVPPSVFSNLNEKWMMWLFHPIEYEIPRRDLYGKGPYSYNPSDFLWKQLTITRAGLFSTFPQQAIITGIESKSQVAKLKDIHDKVEDGWIRQAIRRALEQYYNSSKSMVSNPQDVILESLGHEETLEPKATTLIPTKSFPESEPIKNNPIFHKKVLNNIASSA